MKIEPRSVWGARKPESVTGWNVSALDGICQHWFGSPRAASSHAGCDDLLRSVQRSHQAGEYSDIAYNFGVCPHGVVFELRGWNTKTGANGTSDANSRFLAIVYMAGTGDPLTAKGKKALQDLYAEAFRRGVAEKAITHGSITGSACPGPPVKAWLASGAWKPTPSVPAGPQTEWRLVVGGRIKHRERHTPGMRPTAYHNIVKFLGSPAGTKLVKDGADAKPPQKSCLVRVRS